MTCHDSTALFPSIGTKLHGLHSGKAFTDVGGTCMSCHDVDAATGEMELWDLVKYDLFRGIVDMDASEGSFSWDQTTTTDHDNVFGLDWLYGPIDSWRYVSEMNGVEVSDETFDNWEISVSGMVDNPYTVKLKDLIDEGLSVTSKITMDCHMNTVGSGLIANCEVTGIPIRTLLDRAGIQEGALEFYTVESANSSSYPFAFSWLDELEDDQALLVYEIDGERLTIHEGYPVQAWIGGIGAPSFTKQINSLVVADDPVEDLFVYNGNYAPGSEYDNKPETAIFYTKEGQIIDVGEPFTFEGIADAYNESITAVEISMDRGETWTTYETTDADNVCWVYWRYTFTPQTEGAYVIMVRSVTSTGLVSGTPVSMMVNAE